MSRICGYQESGAQRAGSVPKRECCRPVLRDQGGRREFSVVRDSRPNTASGSVPGKLIQKPFLGDQVLQKKEVLRKPIMGR